MSDNIATMTDKQLRNEVQLLRDELAIMKRKYEDIIYNLDTENFSSRFVKEQGDMRTAIEITAKGIEAKVSKDEMGAFEESILSQTSSEIKATVKKEIDDGNYVTQSDLSLTADGIRATVWETYDSLQSEFEITTDGISTRVGKVENGQFGEYTLFTQSGDTFKFDGKYMLINSAIQIADNSGNHSFSIFHNEGQPYSDGERGTYIGAAGHNATDPLFLGSETQKVYLYSIGEDNLIATRGWVRENAGVDGEIRVVAVFG